MPEPLNELQAEHLRKAIRCGAKMRAAQKAYYAHKGSPREDGHKQTLLHESKALEKRFDAMLTVLYSTGEMKHEEKPEQITMEV